ncbi:MAG TPA: mechanosensitive ion channel domain-containing protein [Thermoleophilaceae bacterium]|nr:mechanosensitive ion channel domain-containing protein [Thermoleophilaceae bacterium]
MSLVIANVLDRAGDSLGDFLPQLGGALALLIVGLLLALLLGRLTTRALVAAGLDQLAARWRVDETLASARLSPSLARLAGSAVRIVVSVVVVFAALTLLGLEPLSESLNEAVLYLPNLLVALALLLAGVVLAGFARERVDRLTYQMDFAVPLGQFAQVSILAIFALMALAQLGVSAGILVTVIVILLAAAAATFALAFGLGGREVAKALNAGRFVRSAFEIGQRISVGDVSGEIVAIEPEATVVRTAEGSTRVPNHMLIESVVTVHGPPRAAGEQRAP